MGVSHQAFPPAFPTGDASGWPSAEEAKAAAAAERTARDAYGKLVARLARRTGDIEAAEDALCHAFAKALQAWPRTGVPDAPQAWLTTTALNAMRDVARRTATQNAGLATLRILAEERSLEQAVDDRLGLILAASHPAIAPDVHAPLILQTIFGLTAQEIAPAFLVKPAALSQRLVRAKAKIKAAGIPFDPDPPDRRARLVRALDAVYALYTIAAAAPPTLATAGRRTDALHIAGLIASLAPDEPEARGLCALIAFCEARWPAKRGPDGAFVPLSRQDPARWLEPLLARGERDLAEASKFRIPGRYQLEAAIQSIHANRRRTGATDWSTIAMLYDVLVTLSPTVGASVARAAAHAEAFGAQSGLALLDEVPTDAATGYQPYWAVRAHLERRLGQNGETALDRAIALSDDEAVRDHLTALKDS
ncbi:MAG: DUF6596 domain-containing protein [Pseudomonadota bacterium]